MSIDASHAFGGISSGGLLNFSGSLRGLILNRAAFTINLQRDLFIKPFSLSRKENTQQYTSSLKSSWDRGPKGRFIWSDKFSNAIYFSIDKQRLL